MKKSGKMAKREALLMLAYMLCLGLLCGPSIYNQYRDLEKKEKIYLEDMNEDAAYASASTAEESPKIALTFDDGPSGSWTPVLLDGLKERGVKGTFFLIGKNVEEYPEVVKRLYEEGHLIGNHTYHHVQLTNLSKEEAGREILDTNETIRKITGEEVEYMRPPFGAWQKDLELEMPVLPVMWTIDPLDWTTENTDEVVNKVVTEAEENDIILLHDCYKSSVEAALRIIDILQKEGFEFVTVDELLMK